MVFGDAVRKTSTTYKISTFFKDLNFLNPRSHFKDFIYFPKLKEISTGSPGTTDLC